MRTKIGMILAFLWVIILPLQAQNEKTEPFIEVVGTAELEIVPDEIYVQIVLRERLDNKNKIGIEEQEKNLKSTLHKLGIDLENLSLSDAQADYVKIKWQKKEVLSQKEYVLKLSTTEEIGKVFGELDRLEIKDAHIIRVDHSKIEMYKKDVRIMAMKAASEKAEYILNAINYKSGMPLHIREESDSYLPYAPNVTFGLTTSESYKSEELPELSFKKIVLHARIYAQYAIIK